ncbi:TonB-dependent receptor plug domain-containing protein [Luteimonas sp. SDU82]|uniref:TonB-dependent receptor plug domain-containing protein n=1 Tax=Luteimonas sp. SDU82 TaxID=3422592 RepID=UPI003EBCE63E
MEHSATEVPKELDAVTVTGTRIRGGTSPSPVITIGAEHIREEGFTDLGDVIRSVPQNFGGGQNPGVAAGATLGAGGRANQNITGGSSLNLRGLGPDATLTLLNGRRMSYGGFSQTVDISAIPVEAVERIEIVPDGSSAIYGSDAVGGVGNVLLKREMQGVSVGARYGRATEGGLSTHEYSATAGTTWSSGGLIATYKDLSVDPIFADQRDYTAHMAGPTTLYAASDLRSGLLSGYQALGDAVELRLDALETRREQTGYYVSGGIHHLAPRTTTSLLAPAVVVSLDNDWQITGAGTWGKDQHIQHQTRQNTATGETALLFHGCYCNRSRIYELGAEGPLGALPGGDARLAVGAGYRTNDYSQSSYLTGAIAAEGVEGVRSAYVELSLPWIGPHSSVAGARRLEMTAALRTEDYETFGRVTTPRLGLIYDPGTDLTLKASWGRSFKAPTLLQRFYTPFHWLDLPSRYGGAGYPAGSTVLLVDGGNPELGPERARTWSASVALHPDAVPGLELELGWFDIDYTDRVIAPITDWGSALTNADYAEFVDLAASPAAQAALLADAVTLVNLTGAPYDPAQVVAIVHGRNVNAERQRIRGLDLSGAYRIELDAGRLTVRGSAALLDIAQKTAGTQTAYELTGRVYNPARVNARIGAVWDRGAFTASSFANYTGGVTNGLDGRKTASFTTLDATLRYAVGDGAGAWSGLDVALTAQNLFNREPPLHAVADLGGARQVPPYDSTNFAAIGRFLGVSIAKRW